MAGTHAPLQRSHIRVLNEVTRTPRLLCEVGTEKGEREDGGKQARDTGHKILRNGTEGRKQGVRRGKKNRRRTGEGRRAKGRRTGEERRTGKRREEKGRRKKKNRKGEKDGREEKDWRKEKDK